MKKMNQKGFAHLTALVLVAVLAVGAIGVTVYRHNNTNAYAITYYGCTQSTLQGEGNDNSCVKAIQIGLNAMGCTPRLDQDSNFGPKTKANVMAFQKAVGMKVQDGVVGKYTWPQLLKYQGKHLDNCKAAPISPPTTSSNNTNTNTNTNTITYRSWAWLERYDTASRQVYKGQKFVGDETLIKKSSGWVMVMRNVNPGYPTTGYDQTMPTTIEGHAL